MCFGTHFCSSPLCENAGYSYESQVNRLLIATGNRHKTQEIRALLGPGWQVEDLSAYPSLPSPEETGKTFAANAAIKALAASAALPGVQVLSDDSGIEVDALGGAPGVYSARYAGENATDKDNRERLKKELGNALAQGVQQPFKGRFCCCMALAQDGQVLALFEGTVEGSVRLEEEGQGGFGYDPLFVPEGYDQTFGTLPSEVKNQLSHRARALQKALTWFAEHS